MLCAQDACPVAAKKDCADWLSEVEKALPSAVFVLLSGDGSESTQVRVLVDGRLVQSVLDGHAVTLDPGIHTVRFEPQQGNTVELRVTLSEGQKNKRVEARVAALPAATKTPSQSSELDSKVWLAGASSLLFFGAFAYIGAGAAKDADHLRTTCEHHCPSAEVDDVGRRLLLADLSLGAGLLTAGLSAYWYFSPTRTAKTLGLSLQPLTGGAMAGFRSSF